MPLVPLDDAAQPAGAAGEVEAQRELVQVLEGFERELAHGVLADRGEEYVAQLLEAGIDDVAEAISDDQHQRDGDAHDEGVVGRGTIERVDDALVGEGDERGRHLGDQQRADGEDNPELEVGPILRPHVPPQVGDGAP
jgi:hypothetical protein